jgi:hypothetical protein
LDCSSEESDASESSSESTELPATFKSSAEMSAFFLGAGTGAGTGAGATTEAGATTGAGAAAAEVITAVFFDAPGLSTFFFLEPDARAEDGEETLPLPSLLRFLDKREEAAGISIKLLGNELLSVF